VELVMDRSRWRQISQWRETPWWSQQWEERGLKAWLEPMDRLTKVEPGCMEFRDDEGSQ